MSYQGNYPGEPDIYVEAEYTNLVKPQPHRKGLCLRPRSVSSMMGDVMEEAMVEATHDRCRALLAKAGMEHTAALSMMEMQFSNITPQGTLRYAEIVDAYAKRAADKVRRW